MSQYDRIAILMIARTVGLRLMGVFALAAATTGCTAVMAAGDVPVVSDAINAGISAGQRAGDLSPAQIWAIVAGVFLALFVLLGWGVYTFTTSVQVQLATIQTQLGAISQARSGPCGAGDALHALLNAARTELEKTGRLIRGEPT